MSENDNTGVYLGIFLGKDRYSSPKLTLGAPDVAGVMKHLNDLLEIDETDPDGLSPVNALLDSVKTIDAAVTAKMGIVPQAPTSPDGGFTPGGYDNAPSNGPTCSHGPMKYKSGTSKAGKPYSGYFCPAPYGTQQCKPQFDN